MQTIDFRLHHIVRYCGLERGNAFAVSFEETFHKIKGIEKLLQLNPRFYGWCYFGKIHSMYLYSDYDYEEWLEIQNLRMVMESEEMCIRDRFWYLQYIHIPRCGPEAVLW